MKFETLKNMINPVFENSEIWEVDLIFSEEIELTEDEYKDLTKNADPLQEIINDTTGVNIYTDTYEWWEFNNQYLELEIDYYRQNDKIYLLELHFWRKVKK